MASITALAVAASAVAVLAITSEGYSATSVDINDGGVWVARPGQVGRLNTQLNMLDGFGPKGAQTPKIIQEGGEVFTVNPDGAVYSLVPATVQLTSPLQLPPGFGFDARGGIGVIWDPQTGRVWVRPSAEILGVDLDALKDKADIKAGQGASAVVGTDGAVHVLSVDKDELTTIPSRSSGSTDRTVTPIGHDITKAALTTVGATPVVLDEETGTLTVRGREDATVDVATQPVLQQPGPAADAVLVGVDKALLAVPLTGGAPATVLTASAPTTSPVAPARVGSSIFAAWNSPAWVATVRGAKVAENQPVPGIAGNADLTIRVNRGHAVLNDVLTGELWNLDDKIVQADDNWDDAQKEDQRTEQTKPDDTTLDDSTQLDRSGPNRPPVAENDRFGARPGQGAILRPLVNDTDPDGDVLVIKDVDDIPASVGRLETIGGGLELQFTPAPDTGGTTASFRYTIDDGRGKSDSATITVDVPAQNAKNQAPVPVAGRVAATIVETGSTVNYNVMDDWRDPDGDPLQLAAASSNDKTDTVRFNPDGTLTITAGPQPGKRAIDVTLTDGTDQTTGKLSLQVRPEGPLEPSARPDHYTATVGEPIVLDPLRNDTDPNGDAPALVKIDKINVAGVTQIEDLNAGTIRFSAAKPDSYTFLYYISGGSKPVPGVIRVDVQAKTKNSPPVPVLDVVTLGSDLTAVTDVTLNDTDADGDVLVVTSVSDVTGMTVAVREHRVLEITAAKVPTADVALTYEVTDGKSDPVQGSVIVRRPVFGDGQNQPPNANPDRAVVRVGDVVSIPVLDNDTDADGDPLTLDSQIKGLDGTNGLGFVSGNVIRFQAPETPGTVKLVYSATDGKDLSSSRVTISVRKLDGKNQPPVPKPVTTRVVSAPNTKISIPVPLDGIDPDGDSVHLVGIDEPSATLGRVEVVDGTLVYTPRVGAASTDTFGYRVADALGAEATGLVRVGVVPETGANQPPTPSDDFLEATPGKTVSVDVLANDSDPDGQQPRLYVGKDYPTIEAQPGVTAKVVGQRIQVKVPADGQTAGLAYWVEDGSGGVASATLTVVGSAAVKNLPPVARDDYVPDPKAGQTTTAVDVLANDEDPDGTAANLKVTRVIPADAASIAADGKSVSVTLGDHPRAIAYEISDGQDVAIAFAFAPALAKNQPPALIPGKVVTTQAGAAPLVLDVSDYVADPDSPAVRLGALDKVRGDSLGEAVATSETQITYTPSKKAYGNGAITLEAIDGPTIQDADNVVLLTIPVVVDPPANLPPIVRDGKLTVGAGDDPSRLDLAKLVTDDKGDVDTFGDLLVDNQGIDVSLDGSTLTASAGADVAKGTAARATFTVTDTAGEATKGTVTIRVTGSTKPLAKLANKNVPEATAGKPVTIEVGAQTSYNPFPDTPLTIVSEKVVSGDATITATDTAVTITPNATFYGQVSAIYQVQDKTGDPDREVEGRIVLNVQGPPDQPKAPTKVTTGDQTATIAWVTPNANGTPITAYLVTWTGGQQDCGNVTQCTITGLQNDKPYRFTVTAVNKVGPSDPSPPSEPITPDVAPESPPTPTVVRPDTEEGTVLEITWGAFVNKGSTITGCTLSNGIEERPVPCDSRSGSGKTTWTGLTNGQGYEFRVKATNNAGTSDFGDGSDRSLGVPAGRPMKPGAPTAAVAGAEAGGRQAKVDWTPPDARGANITGYTLTIYRDGAKEKSVDFSADTVSATVDVAQNGKNYTFSLIATNVVGASQEGDQSAAIVPFGPPVAVASVQAVDADQSAVLNFTAPDDNGKAIVRYEAQSSAGGTAEITPGGSFTGLANGQSYTFMVRACNDYCGPWSPASNPVVPFGPPGQASVSASVVSGTTVRVTWSAPAPNGRDIANTVVTINGAQTTEAASGSRDVTVGGGQTVRVVAHSCDTTGACGPDSAQASATTPPPASVRVYNNSGYVGIDVSNWPHDGLIGCFIGAPTNNWQRNINVVGGSGSNASQIGTGTTWYYQGPTTVDCEGVQGSG